MSERSRPEMVKEFTVACGELQELLSEAGRYYVVHRPTLKPMAETDAEVLDSARSLYRCALKLRAGVDGSRALYESARPDLVQVGNDQGWDVDRGGIVEPGWHLWFFRWLSERVLAQAANESGSPEAVPDDCCPTTISPPHRRQLELPTLAR